MIIESKIIAVILFVFGTFFLLYGLIVLFGVRKIDNEYIGLFSLVLGYSLIIAGIQLWQI